VNDTTLSREASWWNMEVEGYSPEDVDLLRKWLVPPNMPSKVNARSDCGGTHTACAARCLDLQRCIDT
jgi:hypothetical protein